MSPIPNPFHRSTKVRQAIALSKFKKRLEAVVGVSVNAVEPRDTVERNAREVEEIWSIDGRRLAVEHKTLDIFPDQRAMEVRINAVLDPVVDQLQGRFPFHIEIHLYGDAQLARRDLETLRLRIADAVDACVPLLTDRELTRIEVSNCPFDLHVRKIEEFEGSLVRKYAKGPPDESVARRDAVVAILEKAAPKFLRYTGQLVEKTLLLDVADIQLENFIVTGASFRAAAIKRPDLAEVFDFVFLVDTKWIDSDRVPPYEVNCLKHRAAIWPESRQFWDNGRPALYPEPSPIWRW